MMDEAAVEKAVRSAAGSLRLEGMSVSQEESDMVKKCLRGEITEVEYQAWVLRRAGVRS